MPRRLLPGRDDAAGVQGLSRGLQVSCVGGAGVRALSAGLLPARRCAARVHFMPDRQVSEQCAALDGLCGVRERNVPEREQLQLVCLLPILRGQKHGRGATRRVPKPEGASLVQELSSELHGAEWAAAETQK